MTQPTRNRPRNPRRPATHFDQNIQKAMVVEADSPLDYMLRIIRDPTAAPKRRDRMARAAAQYCHPRAADYRSGKRHHEAEAAKKA